MSVEDDKNNNKAQIYHILSYPSRDVYQIVVTSAFLQGRSSVAPQCHHRRLQEPNTRYKIFAPFGPSAQKM